MDINYVKVFLCLLPTISNIDFAFMLLVYVWKHLSLLSGLAFLQLPIPASCLSLVVDYFAVPFFSNTSSTCNRQPFQGQCQSEYICCSASIFLLISISKYKNHFFQHFYILVPTDWLHFYSCFLFSSNEFFNFFSSLSYKNLSVDQFKLQCVLSSSR